MPTTTAWIMVWRIGPVSSNLENREEGAFSPFFLYGPADESEPYTATAFGTAPPSCEQKYFCCCPAWPRGFSFQADERFHLVSLFKTISTSPLCPRTCHWTYCGESSNRDSLCAFLVLGITWTFFGRDIILKKRKSVPERVDFSPERFDGKRGFHKTFKPSENHCPILLPESG